MNRPRETPLDRLRRKVWIRALRIDAMNLAGMDPEGDLDATTWKGLARGLLAGYGDAVAKGRLQGILGVVRHGNDPRGLWRWIPLGDYSEATPEKPPTVHRKAPGPASKGETKSDKREESIKIKIDLIEAGEALCPGSSRWESAYLWALCNSALPRLEELRVAIACLKHRLGLCSPSLDEYRPYLPAPKFEEYSRLTLQQQVDRYAASLAPLASQPSADSLSLLSALVAESFITDHDVLLDLHRDYFNRGMETLLAHPLMSDISDEFKSRVATKVLGLGWELPTAYHVSSLTAPFITMEQWQEITGIQDWISILD